MRAVDGGRAASTAALQGELWSARARDWAELHEHLHTPLYQAAFDAMGIGPGIRLLDAGCGSGVAAGLGHPRRAGGEPAVRATVQQALGPFRTPGGGVRLENTLRYLLARA